MNGARGHGRKRVTSLSRDHNSEGSRLPTESVYSLRLDSFFLEPYEVNGIIHIRGEFPQSESNSKKRLLFIRPCGWILRLVAEHRSTNQNACCWHRDVTSKQRGMLRRDATAVPRRKCGTGRSSMPRCFDVTSRCQQQNSTTWANK